jgi:hypothetical protein
MKDIFLAIQTAVKTAAPSFRHIDFDLGQLDQETPPVSYPCLLVGFNDDDNWMNIGGGVQKGGISVTVKMAFKILEKTSSVIAAPIQAQALSHLDTAKLAHKAIQFLEGENFTKLSRSGIGNENRSDLRIYYYTYTCTYYDNDNAVMNTYTPWQQLPKSPFGTTGPQLATNLDIVPSSINQNINTTFYINQNQSMNYHAILNLDGLLILNGLLNEV